MHAVVRAAYAAALRGSGRRLLATHPRRRAAVRVVGTPLTRTGSLGGRGGGGGSGGVWSHLEQQLVTRSFSSAARDNNGGHHTDGAPQSDTYADGAAAVASSAADAAVPAAATAVSAPADGAAGLAAAGAAPGGGGGNLEEPAGARGGAELDDHLEPRGFGGGVRPGGVSGSVDGEEDTSVYVEDMKPSEVIRQLDRHIVGQKDAKRAVAIALRNRWRRQRLPEGMRREIVPRNMLMIGPTGCGKTEIARRLSQLLDAPFVKVEATKFTEVSWA
jgi:hypothetical protein